MSGLIYVGLRRIARHSSRCENVISFLSWQGRVWVWLCSGSGLTPGTGSGQPQPGDTELILARPAQPSCLDPRDTPASSRRTGPGVQMYCPAWCDLACPILWASSLFGRLEPRPWSVYRLPNCRPLAAGARDSQSLVQGSPDPISSNLRNIRRQYRISAATREIGATFHPSIVIIDTVVRT